LGKSSTLSDTEDALPLPPFGPSLDEGKLLFTGWGLPSQPTTVTRLINKAEQINFFISINS